MNITLVRALTQLAWDNDRAAEQAPARLVPILQATSQAADEAARHVQFNRLDQLTERQRKMIEELTHGDR